jgi:hypothetical protein
VAGVPRAALEGPVTAEAVSVRLRRPYTIGSLGRGRGGVRLSLEVCVGENRGPLMLLVSLRPSVPARDSDGRDDGICPIGEENVALISDGAAIEDCSWAAGGIGALAGAECRSDDRLGVKDCIPLTVSAAILSAER